MLGPPMVACHRMVTLRKRSRHAPQRRMRCRPLLQSP